MGTALVRLSMPGGVEGQRRKPLPTRLKYSPPFHLYRLQSSRINSLIMANTYTKLYIHLILIVWCRFYFLHEKHEEDIYRYISGIITKKGHKSIIINGMPDHLHILLGLKPSESIYDLVREIKKSSTNYIDKNRFVRGKFGWQKGYGAFSYIQTQLDTVYKYIANQKEHY